ncbi:hypothetical protein LJC47_00275 [Desulfosarcina sp. OttesenSCG-928-B08]|nr:hypothetical protein [Desulfosarcina sp. OttesenSCG-928-B08]
MRREKTVTIQIDKETSRTFTVYEIRPKDVLDRIFQTGEEDIAISDLFGKDLLPLFTTATPEDLSTLYPSDIKALFDAVVEVNAPLAGGMTGTADVARKVVDALNLRPALMGIAASAATESLGFVAIWLKRVIRTASTTVGDTLSPSLMPQTEESAAV